MRMLFSSGSTKACCLAGAGLRACEKVFAFENMGYCLRLNRGRCRE